MSTTRLLLLKLLNPARAVVASRPRGSLLRSAAVVLLKRCKPHFRLRDLVQTVQPLDMPGVRLHATDSMVIDEVYWLGMQGYEGRMADVWVTLCGHASGVLEVGGNIGIFTVIGAPAARGRARYTVVEPVPGNVAVLRANLALNDIASVDVLQAAAVWSDTASIVMLNVPQEGRDAPVGAQLVAGSEVSGRSSEKLLEVQGLPFVQLIQGCDLIKIDAEGIESELLSAVFEELVARKPTLVIEVLPESHKLAALLRDLALRAGYVIYVVPAYHSDTIVPVQPAQFDANVPRQHHSKDVVLSMTPVH